MILHTSGPAEQNWLSGALGDRMMHALPNSCMRIIPSQVVPAPRPLIPTGWFSDDVALSMIMLPLRPVPALACSRRPRQPISALQKLYTVYYTCTRVPEREV